MGPKRPQSNMAPFWRCSISLTWMTTLLLVLLISWHEMRASHQGSSIKGDDFDNSGRRLELGSTKYSLCGTLQLDAVAGLLPKNMPYFRQRWSYNQHDWTMALNWLRNKEPHLASNTCDGHQQQTHILLYSGGILHYNMTGLNGSPQGELIQWHDLYISLLLLGYHPTMIASRRRLTTDYLAAFDVIITDYHGVQEAMDPDALQAHKCKIRVLDSWGTDAGPNNRDGQGWYCCLKLPSLAQFWTFTPGFSPDNSFLGYSVPSFRPVSDLGRNNRQKRKLEVVLYGKEYRFFKHDLGYISQLTKVAPTHATAVNWTAGVLPAVHQHGVLSSQELHKLMQRSFAYAGFAAVMMGPASLEAISHGMVFLNYVFAPARNLSQLMGKPTTQLWTSQFPFLETQQPHVININPKDPKDVQMKLAVLKQTYEQWWIHEQYDHKQLPADALLDGHVFLAKARGHRAGYVPFEYTTVGMLLRVKQLLKMDFCSA